MDEEGREGTCCKTSAKEGCCCVESVVSIDERGQMVLPKEVRTKANIRAGDKMAVVAWEKNGVVCCISLIKVDGLSEMVRESLSPMMRGIIEK